MKKIFLCVFCFGLFACKDKNNPEPEPEPVVQSKGSLSIYVSAFDSLGGTMVLPLQQMEM
jgi:hypothetical protein